MSMEKLVARHIVFIISFVIGSETKLLFDRYFKSFSLSHRLAVIVVFFSRDLVEKRENHIDKIDLRSIIFLFVCVHVFGTKAYIQEHHHFITFRFFFNTFV